MRRAGVLACVVALLMAGCAGPGTRARGSERVLRLGLFPTLTHAPGYLALGAGIFERELGPTRVEVTTFESGTDAGFALLSGSIDAAYLGPWPSASLYLLSGSVAIVSGASVGGASLIVRSGAGIDEAANLHGRRIAVPDINNTQEVALRSWLHDNGLRTREEGGDVSVVGLGGFEAGALLEHGRLDAAWLPEPYPTYLVERGIANRLVDEASLWPTGQMLSADLVVSTAYLGAHPDEVRALVRANVEAILLAQDDPERARAIVAEQLADAGAPALDPGVFEAAWSELTFTWDPLAESLARVAAEARAIGLWPDPPVGIDRLYNPDVLGVVLNDLDGLYRLDALNDVLNDEGLPPVEVPA